MSFGKNPHVAKAQAAEQKALSARDLGACAMAWREAARQWDRAAERENDPVRRASYAEHGASARSRADTPAVDGSDAPGEDDASVAARDPSLLN